MTITLNTPHTMINAQDKAQLAQAAVAETLRRERPDLAELPPITPLPRLTPSGVFEL